jgi:hypothetical protein
MPTQLQSRGKNYSARITTRLVLQSVECNEPCSAGIATRLLCLNLMLEDFILVDSQMLEDFILVDFVGPPRGQHQISLKWMT